MLQQQFWAEIVKEMKIVAESVQSVTINSFNIILAKHIEVHIVLSELCCTRKK